jgi:hypothetical protein
VTRRPGPLYVSHLTWRKVTLFEAIGLVQLTQRKVTHLVTLCSKIHATFCELMQAKGFEKRLCRKGLFALFSGPVKAIL